MEEISYLTKRDTILLEKAIKEIKRLPNVYGILQIGSSTYSKNYRDIDLIVFFDKILPPPKISEINKKYGKYGFYIEGNYIKDCKIDRGVKIFIKFLSNLKTKRILYGKYPYYNLRISINKIDVAYNIRYHYNFALCTQDYGNILSVSMNTMLIYKNIFPQNKKETLKLFKKTYPKLAKFLPNNAEFYLRNTNKSNFKNLHKFFQESLVFFSK